MRYMSEMMIGGMTRQMTPDMARMRAQVSAHTGSLVRLRMAGLSLSVLDTSITSAPGEVKVSLRMSVVLLSEMRS